MKNLLVALLALSAVSAFADNHSEHMHEGKNLKHMVRFMGFNDSGVSNSFDLSFATAEKGDTELSSNSLALNYAYAINSNWQIGGKYMVNTSNFLTDTGAKNDTENTTYGISGYYNFGKSLDSTSYVGLHYDMMTNRAEDESTIISAEYGHRFHVGHVWGLHLTYAPSITFSQSTTEFDAGGDDLEAQALAWNWIKFDVLF